MSLPLVLATFHAHDDQNFGTIEYEDMCSLLERLGSPVKQQAMQTLVKAAGDCDRNGAIDYVAFVSWLIEGELKKNRQVPTLALDTSSVVAANADNEIDLHGRRGATTCERSEEKESSVDETALQHVVAWVRGVGTALSKDSFLEMMEKVDSQLSKHEISEIFEEVDWDCSGGLDAEEIEDWMRNDLEGRYFVPKLREYFKTKAMQARHVPSLALGTSSTVATTADDGLGLHRPVDRSNSQGAEDKDSPVNEEAFQQVLAWLRGVGPELSKENFSEMLKKVDSQLSDQETSDIFEEVDWDSSGALDAAELEDWMRNDVEGRDFIPKLLEYFKARAAKARQVPSIALGTAPTEASPADGGPELHRSKDASASEGAQETAGSVNEDTLQNVLALLRGVGPSISKENFLDMMKKADLQLCDQEIFEIFEEVDWDSSGDLDADELEDWMRNDLEGREFVPRLLEYFKKDSGKVRG